MRLRKQSLGTRNMVGARVEQARKNSRRKALHIAILILGLLTILLSASASDSGADLLYTVPTALCGCGLIGLAAHGYCKATPEDIKERNRGEIRRRLGHDL